MSSRLYNEIILEIWHAASSPAPYMAIFVVVDDPWADQIWQIISATDAPALPQVVPCIFQAYTCNKW